MFIFVCFLAKQLPFYILQLISNSTCKQTFIDKLAFNNRVKNIFKLRENMEGPVLGIRYKTSDCVL